MVIHSQHGQGRWLAGRQKLPILDHGFGVQVPLWVPGAMPWAVGPFDQDDPELRCLAVYGTWDLFVLVLSNAFDNAFQGRMTVRSDQDNVPSLCSKGIAVLVWRVCAGQGPFHRPQPAAHLAKARVLVGLDRLHEHQGADLNWVLALRSHNAWPNHGPPRSSAQSTGRWPSMLLVLRLMVDVASG